jgi:hypothetical protein
MSDSVKPWDLLNPNKPKTTEEIQKWRLDLCLSCEFLLKATKQCKKCACFMPMKVQLGSAKCPVGKWDKYE